MDETSRGKVGRRQVLRLSGAAGVAAALAPVAGTAAPVVAADLGMQLWFIRHAQSVINLQRDRSVPDSGVSFPLTAKGVRQAQALAKALGTTPVAALYASARLRAIQTADALGFAKTLTLEIAPEAVEADTGAIPADGDPGRVVVQLSQRWRRGEIHARHRKGESLAQLRARFVPLVQKLIERHRNESRVVVLVAHNGTISWTMPSLASNVSPGFAFDPKNGLPNTGIVKTVLRDGKLFVTDWAGKRPW